jgi:hypothetical protein
VKKITTFKLDHSDFDGGIRWCIYIYIYIYIYIQRDAIMRSLYSLFRCTFSGFGGLLVRMQASGTRDRGFEPGRSENIFSMPSFGGEVKPSVPSRKVAAC